MALYSRPLGEAAKQSLVDFLEAYIESLKVAEVDKKAEIAKQKALACLQTDIDILAFVTTFWAMLQAVPLMEKVMEGSMSSSRAARQIVDISEQARSLDRSWRPGGIP